MSNPERGLVAAVLITAAAAGAVTLTAAPAHAAPTSNVATYTIQCAGDQPFEVLAPGNPDHQVYAAAFVAGTDQVLLPLAFVGGPAKAGPIPSDAHVCSLYFEDQYVTELTFVLRGRP